MPTILGNTTKWNIFHYTNLSAIPSIFRSECIVLWATNASYLNDPSELIYGINIVNEIEHKNIHPDMFRNYYLTSFSQDDDSLVMWSQYGAGGDGCSIGFDYDSIATAYGVVGQCIYGKNDASTHLKGFLHLSRKGAVTNLNGSQLSGEQINEIKEATINDTIISTCLCVKHNAYKHENETRGIIHVGEDKYKVVNFRCRSGFIIPYVQISLPKNAVRKIVIGPTLNGSITMKSIKQMLLIRGYNIDAIEVVNSNVPYRG